MKKGADLLESTLSDVVSLKECLPQKLLHSFAKETHHASKLSSSVSLKSFGRAAENRFGTSVRSEETKRYLSSLASWCCKMFETKDVSASPRGS